MYGFCLFRFLSSAVCYQVLRFLTFFVKFFLGEAVKMFVLVVLFPRQTGLRSVVEMACVYVKCFLDEAFKMRVLVSFPPQPDWRSGAGMPCVFVKIS